MSRITPADKLDQLRHYFNGAAQGYKDSDMGRWAAAKWCGRVVGKYQRGSTIDLAAYMGVSVDTVENLAHAYWMFIELCKWKRYRAGTVAARKMATVHYSHFRALYDAWKDYGLTLDQVYSLLVDVVQNEGSLSSRDVDIHARECFGDPRNWQWYAVRAQRKIHDTLQCPDLPEEGRKKLGEAYSYIGDNA